MLKLQLFLFPPSLPPSPSLPLASPLCQCATAIWKLHAKCGGTHHREGTGEERRNPFITGRGEQRNAKIHGIQRGFCLLKGCPSLKDIAMGKHLAQKDEKHPKTM